MQKELKLNLYDLIPGSQQADIRAGKQNSLSCISA